MDRHWAGSGKVMLDSSIVADYLEITGDKQLSSNFEIVDIPEVYPIASISFY